MKIAFTICSNNYLAKAKIVADSFVCHHSDYKFIIFLVDTYNQEINYDSFSPHSVIEINTVVKDISRLALIYNIIELNTAVKPAAFRYLFEQFNSSVIIYLDPDLVIYDRFEEVEHALNISNNNVVVTPHFCSPIDDGKYPSELDFSVYGLYNLGFIAVKNTPESLQFLEWWHNRLMKYCFIRPEKGMFTDQIWVNYAPVFFEGVFILKHLGYNVANWNLYERAISKAGDNFFINNAFKLKFFHFSHFDFENPYSISKSQTRHSIDDVPAMKEMLDNYKNRLISNDHPFYNRIVSHYQQLYISHHAEQSRIKQLQDYTIKKRIKRKVTSYLTFILGE